MTLLDCRLSLATRLTPASCLAYQKRVRWNKKKKGLSFDGRNYLGPSRWCPTDCPCWGKSKKKIKEMSS